MVGQGWVGATEFWKLKPGQVWWIIEAHLPEKIMNTHNDFEELYDMVLAAEQEEAANELR